MNAPDFTNRWLITGTLTTESELHIGDGGAGELHHRDKAAIGDMEHDASTVCVAHNKRAYIPGSGIKGALRALVSDEHGQVHPDWVPLLGSGGAIASDAVGGKLEFWDACWIEVEGSGKLVEQPDPENLHLAPDRKRPWWDNSRRTCVAVAVSLDRRTKTAKDNLLYHLEYVPAGETFRFEISGEDLVEDDVKKLVALLGNFNTGALTLGALTSSAWGQLGCNIESVRCLRSLEDWKKNPAVGLAAVTEVPPDFTDANALLKAPATPPQRETLSINLRLTTDSPWLIRDARQRERSKFAKDNKDRLRLDEGEKPPDAVPIRDEDGRPFVPAKSLRGALCARAEMILRTLDLPCATHPGDIDSISSKGRSTGDVIKLIRDGDTGKAIEPKDLGARLFGFGGWRGPLQISALTQVNSPKDHHQEFVAIDRFTGGAADGAKFDAILAGMTNLDGTITVDLGRLKLVDSDLASLGLLALVLRDLAEGDIPIGSGSAKGQGSCRAEAKVTVAGASHDSLADWFSSKLVADAITAFRNTKKPAVS